MLSYQHDYHAGNHADVLKHAVLALLIRALQRKPGAVRVIDTHAGSGSYDLTGELPGRRREHDSGIVRLLGSASTPPTLPMKDAPPSLTPYLEVLAAVNPDGRLRWYPGSPQVAAMLLREQDRLEAFELHPQAWEALRTQFGGHPRIHLHRRDGFEGLPAVVPPRERRGVVLIDPSYEQKDDYGRVAEAVAAAHARWSNGVIAIWYPLIRHPGSSRLVSRLARLKLPGLYQVELEVARDAPGLRGSGLLVVNLPYQIDDELERLLPWLRDRLSPEGNGTSSTGWLV